MPTSYTVKPGDNLSKIAVKHGFNNYREIYDHPSNAAFRAKRPNPNFIFPGDVIIIPDKGGAPSSPPIPLIIPPLSWPPIPTPPAKICGPDISNQLSEVLLDVRRTFSTWDQSKKREQCDAVRSLNPLKLKQTLMAWDIEDLYLPNTIWLYNLSFIRANCGTPCSGQPGSPNIENAATSPCGNSVQVGDGCYLAGTVNYALFGEICRLCRDEFQILDKVEMERLIWWWKTLDRDDLIPPTQWANWGFDRGSVTSPPKGPAENRSSCTGRCSEKIKIRFTWRWLPHYPGFYKNK